ncbi:ThiF family adenylyltransferase [Tomitella biformata]|uniref:ThiF family adenylyltransferase n=1 Tax=Tomitella biformata TaxID=630403 RepID=UPI00056E8E1C|nr:ThiF family adenylyltransferase [Tomitella biformata]
MSPLAPVVSPGPELTATQRARFHRHVILPDLGEIGQRRLCNAKVLVIGAGGLGSPALLYLTAAGVGTIGIVDFDVVETSNLHRQVIHGHADVGRLKAESARDSMLAIDADAHVVLHTDRLEPGNAVELFSQYDLILDGTDNFATRYLVNDAAALAGKPYVWGSIFRFEGQISVFWDAAPDGRAVNYRDLYPTPPPPGTVPSCAEGGVLGVLCAAVGSIMATEAVKLIAGLGEPLLGRLLCYDALAMTHRTIQIRKDPGVAPITELTDYDAFCGLPSAAVGGEVTADELRDILADPTAVDLIDVREQAEWDIAHLPGARLIPMGRLRSQLQGGQLTSERPIVLYCKVGARSAEALGWLREAGFADSRHLAEGIDGWSRRVDPSLPRY